MLNKTKIARINFLHKKYQDKTITPGEETERQQLRLEYIKSVKASLELKLQSVKIQTPDGKLKKLKKRI